MCCPFIRSRGKHWYFHYLTHTCSALVFLLLLMLRRDWCWDKMQVAIACSMFWYALNQKESGWCLIMRVSPISASTACSPQLLCTTPQIALNSWPHISGSSRPPILRLFSRKCGHTLPHVQTGHGKPRCSLYILNLSHLPRGSHPYMNNMRLK